jgi:hypothetical protein
MDQRNPYAPPAASTAPATPQQPPPGGVAADEGTLNLSSYGWEVVSDMAKWMRIVAGFFYVFGGIMALVGLGFLACASRFTGRIGGAMTAGVIAGTVLYAVFLIVSATWLRGAAKHFYEGVMGDATSPLALGFRKLRLYLIGYGLVQLVGLATTIIQVVAR